MTDNNSDTEQTNNENNPVVDGVIDTAQYVNVGKSSALSKKSNLIVQNQ